MATKQIIITKADLEQASELDAAEKFYLWLKKWGNTILGIVTVVFAVFAAFTIYRGMGESRLRAANDKFYAAATAYEKALQEQQWATNERVEAMRAVIKQADEIVAEFGSTPIAESALFLKANAYYFAGDPLGSTANTQEAIKYFGQYLDKVRANGDGFEVAAALVALGYAHENAFILSTANEKGAADAYTAAMKNYDDAIATKGAGFLANEAKNSKARLLAFQGKKDEAKKLYREVFFSSYEAPPEIPEKASQRERTLSMLKTFAGQFTAAATAKLQLQYLGEDIEALEKEAKDKKGKK